MRLTVKRRRSPEEEPYFQTVELEPREGDTVASVLLRLNADPEARDTEGRPLGEIAFEHSCLQRKCGACAMVVNGRPMLACDARLRDLGDSVALEPLRKFPVVRDLIVDRSAMMEALRTMELWLRDSVPPEGLNDRAYEASRCLQCGCCLEICPNFCIGDSFLGTAAMVPYSRLLEQLPDKESRRSYIEHFYEGCGKSLACRNVCPAGIDVDGLLAGSNGAALFKGLFRRIKIK